MFGTTVDPNLSNALDQVVHYFLYNIPTVLQAFIAIAVFMWLLRIALHSFGIRANGDLLDTWSEVQENRRQVAIDDQDEALEERRLASYRSVYEDD